VQSSSQIVTTNKPTPNFLQAVCRFCHPTNNVETLKGNGKNGWLDEKMDIGSISSSIASDNDYATDSMHQYSAVGITQKVKCRSG